MITSAEARKDPSMTRSITRSYERRIAKLFKNYLSKAAALMKMRTYESVRRPTMMINFTHLADSLLWLIESQITMPGRDIMSSMIDGAMKAGQVRASAFLRAVGVQATLGSIMVDPQVREVLNDRALTLLTGVTEDMGKNIKVQLSEGILKGEGMKKLAKRLEETTGMAEQRARLVARTETMYAFNTAAREEYRRYGVEKVEWVAAMDERTCPRCGPLHGRVFPMDQAPDCPLHPNCRCITIPYIEEA